MADNSVNVLCPPVSTNLEIVTVRRLAADIWKYLLYLVVNFAISVAIFCSLLLRIGRSAGK